MKLLQGDALEVLKTLADGTVQCVVTSPPYYGLRQYLQPGQAGKEYEIGLEETPEAYIAKLVAVFRECRRVLKDDGVCWINIGDSYASGWSCNRRSTIGADAPLLSERMSRLSGDLKEKDLIGIPWMLAFALRADGWYLRQDIIWAKPNPMPESVTDRCTKSHEYIFLLSKSARYYMDMDAIAEEVSQSTVERLSQPTLDTQAGSSRVPGKTNGNMKAVGSVSKYSFARKVNEEPPPGKTSQHRPEREDVEYSGKRNKRSVWTVTTKPYKEAHFATYPPDLIEPCILAGTSEKGECPKCGKAWVRETERNRMNRTELPKDDPRYRPNTYAGAYGDINGKGDAGYTEVVTTGWRAQCDCNEHPVKQIVLDPFNGSGTTGLVATGHGRDYIGIELNQDYINLSVARIGGLLLEVS